MKHRLLAKRYWKDLSTPMGKVDELAKGYSDMINLSLGDPDLTTHSIIIENAFEDARRGYTKYTDFRGDPELRREIVKFYAEEYGIDISDEEVFVSTGGCIAMYLVMEAILDDGDEVIMSAPYFTPYPQQIELAHGVPVELPMFEEDNFQINFDRLESLINERTRAIIINTPSNPTGVMMKPENMQRLAEVAIEHDLIVVSDDIYTSFGYSFPFTPIVKLEGMRERTVIINSFSKNFTMTGWRVGNIIAPEVIVKTVQQVNENLSFTVPSISQRAAIYALRNRTIIQPPLIEEYKRRTFYSAERMNRIPKMSVSYPPMGGFYLFPNIKATSLTSTEVSERLLREAHILTIPGNAFGKCGEGHIRFCCTVNMNILREAFDRIEQMPLFSRNE